MSARDRVTIRTVESANALPPEILTVVSLVAEILLDQRRKQIELLRGDMPNPTLLKEQGDEGKAA